MKLLAWSAAVAIVLVATVPVSGYAQSAPPMAAVNGPGNSTPYGQAQDPEGMGASDRIAEGLNSRELARVTGRPMPPAVDLHCYNDANPDCW